MPEAKNEEKIATSMIGSLYNSFGSLMKSATDQINSLLGWEDLEVVDPEGEQASIGQTSGQEGFNQAERKQVWGTRQFQQYIGADVMSLLSVPVWIMEPTTVLQKAAEMMEYTELLDQANQTVDDVERFALVAAYCVSPFGANERTWKPFNPILGETFEVEVHGGVRFLAEQVSHHPPVCAAHAENEHFVYDIVSAPTTQFLGNSLLIYPLGRSRIRLRSSNELYTLNPPTVLVSNIVLGRTWIDCFGTLAITNASNGMSAALQFKQCGWFNKDRYEFVGYIVDSAGKKLMKLSGKWNAYCDAERCDADGNPLPGEVPRRLWTCLPKPEGDAYGFTHFVHKLCKCDNIRSPLPSDSRRRPDRAALYRGESAFAGTEKYRLEEMQRAERAERKARGDTWSPRWFQAVSQSELRSDGSAHILPGEPSEEQVPLWEYNGEYSKLLSEQGEKELVTDAAEVDGASFCPWQYPSIHQRL